MLILVNMAPNASLKDHIYNEMAYFLNSKFPDSRLYDYINDDELIQEVKIHNHKRVIIPHNSTQSLSKALFELKVVQILIGSNNDLVGIVDIIIDPLEKVNLKYLKIAEKAVERLIFIVKDLDLITKLESNNMKLEKSKFNLISIINNVFEMLEIQANKKNISLLIDSKLKRVNVNADQEKIHQVLTNLIENSVKYGKHDGTTEISIEDLIEDKLIIRITDNGKGIKKEHFERLFERFYRVENSGNRSTGGSGLGLAIVKHIIDAHNEKIYVESDFGIGSEFSFSLQKSN